MKTAKTELTADNQIEFLKTLAANFGLRFKELSPTASDQAFIEIRFTDTEKKGKPVVVAILMRAVGGTLQTQFLTVEGALVTQSTWSEGAELRNLIISHIANEGYDLLQAIEVFSFLDSAKA